MTETIGVIGAGAWGTALAMLLADKGHEVTLWMYEQDLAEETARTRENRVYLPGFRLPGSMSVTSDDRKSSNRQESCTLRGAFPHGPSVTRQMLPFLSTDTVIVSASKGIEIETLMPLSEVFKDVLPKEFHCPSLFPVGTELCQGSCPKDADGSCPRFL